MKRVDFLNSSCRHCRFYRPEGRRGGVCQKLSVPVDSNWKACTLACSPFTNSLKKLEDIVHLETAFSLRYANQPSLKVNPKTQEIVGTTNNKTL
ncbi:MAG: hypothetical protein QNJ55_00875 [Xenococcus sp. MO_188.B8]|nr:hypothetical protein [Xenococcus sp. MO_188.B8]